MTNICFVILLYNLINLLKDKSLTIVEKSNYKVDNKLKIGNKLFKNYYI